MVIKILRDGEKILGKGFVDYKASGTQIVEEIEIDENNLDPWVTLPKSKLKWVDGPVLKEESEIKVDLLKKMQSKVLQMLTPVNLAISNQDATNKIKEKKGKALIEVITDDEIEAVGDYAEKVVTFHNTWNPNDYTLEQINESIFNGGLDIPEIIKRYL
jgi:hypothetical protein